MSLASCLLRMLPHARHPHKIKPCSYTGKTLIVVPDRLVGGNVNDIHDDARIGF